jgi:hypothetical protein
MSGQGSSSLNHPKTFRWNVSEMALQAEIVREADSNESYEEATFHR